MDYLSLGARGPNVQLLQASLLRAGFSPGAIDGIFGEATRRALMEFQRDNGLQADGVAGPRTLRALHPWMTGYLVHPVQPGDTFFLLAKQYHTTITAIQTANPDVSPLELQPGQRLVIPLPFPVVFDNIEYTSRVVALCIEGLRARYPFFRVSSAGDSVLGRPLYALWIGSGERQVFFNASHHANEWITTPLLLQFLEEYAAAYSTGSSVGGRSARELFEHTTLAVIPLVNPDGVDLVTGFLAPGSPSYEAAKAMDREGIPFPNGWKANLNGVDLNLQYPAGWEQAKEIKFAQGYTQPGPRDYVGEAPLDQPESQAVAEFTRNADFALTLSYHTQGEVIYWKFLDYDPPDAYRIGTMFANVSGYELALTPYSSGFAGYKDWFIQEYNRPGYTVEVGLGVAPLPITDLPGIYEKNLGIFVISLGLDNP